MTPSGLPTDIETLEWHVSTAELCKAMETVAHLPAMRINPGLLPRDSGHAAVAFKGGSEAGVLNFTHWIQPKAPGPSYCVAVILNNRKTTIDLTRASVLTDRIIRAVLEE